MAGVALIGSEYISAVLFKTDPEPIIKSLIAMSAIGLFYGINLMGLRMSSMTQNILMVVKIGMILLLISSLFFPSAAIANNIQPSQTFSGLDYIKSFGIALIAVSFTYGGYQQTINFGDEIIKPRKTIPTGIFIGIVIIISLYLAVSFAYYKAIGFDELKTSKGIAAIVAESMFGPAGRYVFSILLFVAVLAYVNVLLLSNPRVMYAMSTDGILPKSFMRKNEEKDVLTVSLSVFAGVVIVVLFFAKTFDKILGFTIFLDSIGMATSAATIFILRKRTRHLNGTGIYQMKLYPLLPIIFIASYLFVGISIWISTPNLAWTAIAVFLTFLLIYFIVTKTRKTTKDANSI
jgi:APA family basic amino acid/polyamine antiporter